MREAERFDYDEVDGSLVFELFHLYAKNCGASLIVAKIFLPQVMPFSNLCRDKFLTSSYALFKFMSRHRETMSRHKL